VRGPKLNAELVRSYLTASSAPHDPSHRSISEPVKHAYPSIRYEMASCVGIDHEARTIDMETPVLPVKEPSPGQAATDAIVGGPSSGGRLRSTLPYDVLVVAVGATNNTFGIRGVEEHAFFLKELAEARVSECAGEHGRDVAACAAVLLHRTR
jgi:NADH dehydrogenase FAD-containing subunit